MKVTALFARATSSSFDVHEDKIDRRYLGLIFSANRLESQLDIRAKGSTGYAAVRPRHLLSVTVPLPPLEEQRRIVGRIEEIAGKIEEARRLRRAASSDVLLKSARATVFRNLSRELSSVRLDSVADCRLGKMLSQKAKTGLRPVPYLRNANIQWDRLDLSSVFEMDFSDEEKVTFALRAGDVLVCEGGDIGKAAIWNEELRLCCYQKALHRVRVDATRLVPRYILHHVIWAAEQGHFRDIRTQTTIAHLTGVKLKAYRVYVPTVEGQQRIVNYLDGLQAKVDALRRLQGETEAGLDALLSSVMERAFRGDL